MSQLYTYIQESAEALRARDLTDTATLLVYYGDDAAALRQGLSEVGPLGDIPHCPAAGRLFAGKGWLLLEQAPSFDDGFSMESLGQLPRALRLLGASNMILAGPGSILLPELKSAPLLAVSDHLNLTGDSPLLGPHEPRLGKRFPDMGEAWSKKLRHLAGDLPEAVLAGLSGPGQMTVAQLAYLKDMGADAADWRFLPENQAAVHAGMKVLGLMWPRCDEEGEGPSAETMEAVRSALDAVLEHGDPS